MQVSISRSGSSPKVTLPPSTVEIVRDSYPVDGPMEKLRPVLVALDAGGKRVAAWAELFVSLTAPPRAREVDPEPIVFGGWARHEAVTQ